jgi:hypothetical protein
MKSPLIRSIVVATVLASPVAHASDAVAGVQLGAGTLGAGADLSVPLTDTLSARVGYYGLSQNRTITDNSVAYTGTAKISNGIAVLDWHPGHHLFRVSYGAAYSGTKIDAVGVPANSTFTFNGQTYTISDVGSVIGHFEPGRSVSPYLALGLASVQNE